MGAGRHRGDPIVTVLTEQVSDAHLDGLRKDGVSYIFAGTQELDLAVALETLNRELGIKRLEVNGGGVTNGAFLRAGLVNEISLAIFPAVDGAKGAPSVFDSHDDEAGADDRLVEAVAAHRATEAGVAEAEHAAVGSGQPVPVGGADLGGDGRRCIEGRRARRPC